MTAAAIVFLLVALRRQRLTRGVLAWAGAFYALFALASPFV